MVDNIVLSTLTGPTLATGTDPKISTKDGERDGTRTGGGGPPGGGGGELYSMSSLQYLGAFVINLGADVTSYGSTVSQPVYKHIGFKPPNGTNGTYGSIMCAPFAFQAFQQMSIIEARIPETLGSGTDHTTLPIAVEIGSPVKLTDTHTGPNPNSGADLMGWIREIDGRLFASCYGSYDTDGNPGSLAVFDDPQNLTTSTGTGWITTTAGDFGIGYCNPIPDNYHSALGGTWMMGSGNDSSILTRFSQGPSIHVFDPSSVSNGDSNLTTTEKLNYHYDLSIGKPYALSYPEYQFDNTYMVNTDDSGGIDGYNEAALKWYIEDQLGYVYNQFDQTSLDPTRASGYVDYLDAGATPAFETLTPPPSNLTNDLWNFHGGCSNAFIVPGTKTLMCTGVMGARRYGGGYKLTYRDGLHTAGGQNGVDRNDFDHWYWLYNMDDIIGATNVYDPKPYEYGVFDGNRWVQPISGSDITDADSRAYGIKTGGFFDPDTGRLYTSASPFKVGFWSVTVVAVYQVI